MPNARNVMGDPARTIAVGVTTRDEVRKSMGAADESFAADDRCDIWVYRDVVNVPWFLSFIPVVGNVADTVEFLHKSRELIVQFDHAGVVKKVKVRNID